MQTSEWDLQGPQEQVVSIDQMDTLILKLRKSREEYDKRKKASNEAHALLEEVEKEVMNALKANGRTKFEAEGVALVYIVTKEVFGTPKTLEQKRGLFTYITVKYGEDVLTNLLSMNHQTLNSWANAEIKDDPSLQIPGLDAPTTVESLTFRKKDE